MGSTSSSEVIPVPDGSGFNVRHVNSLLIDDCWNYDFWIQPPSGPSAELPGQLVRRSLAEVTELGNAMAVRHRCRAPPAPKRSMFEGGTQGKAIEGQRWYGSQLGNEATPAYVKNGNHLIINNQIMYNPCIACVI